MLMDFAWMKINTVGDVSWDGKEVLNISDG